MKIFYIGLFSLLFCQLSSAQSGTSSKVQEQNQEKFSVGQDETHAEEYLSNSPSAIQARMVEDVKDKCDAYGCTIAATKREDKGWTFGLNIGKGNPSNNNNNGNTFIIGTTGNSNRYDSEYVGVIVSYRNLECNTELKLEKEWFLTLKAYGAYARDENNKPVPVAKPDTKFFALIVTELTKQLGQAGCNRSQ